MCVRESRRTGILIGFSASLACCLSLLHINSALDGEAALPLHCSYLNDLIQSNELLMPKIQYGSNIK